MLLVLIIIRALLSKAEFLNITTPQGQLAGTVKSYLGENYAEFLGIPYAATPQGNQRFERPEEKSAWTGSLVANRKCLPCYSSNSKSGSEDCLCLNIWAFNEEKVDSYPVMVWIFDEEINSSIDGKRLAALEKLVVVTIEYRKSLFGFLGLDLNHVNNGLYDQKLALTWIKRNIHFFKGNANLITVVGFGSLGAATVGHFLLNPNTSSLFKNAILISGSPISDFAKQTFRETNKSSMSAAKMFDCDYYSKAAEVLSCLKAVPIEKLLQFQKLESFKLTIDSTYINDTSEISAKYLPKNINILLGLNFGDVRSYLFKRFPNNFNTTITHLPILTNQQLSELLQAMTNYSGLKLAVVRALYINWTKQMNMNENVEMFIVAVRDYILTCNMKNFAKLLSISNAQVGFYYFTAGNSLSKESLWFGDDSQNALKWIFGDVLDYETVDSETKYYTMTERYLSRGLMNKYGQFARNGLIDGIFPNWTVYNQQYLIFNGSTKGLLWASSLEQFICEIWTTLRKF